MEQIPVNNTFTIQDKSLSYQTVRGKVLSAERMTEQKVIRNSIKTIINTRIWLKTENNAEQDFLFYDCNIPVKENNDVTVIVLSGNQQDYYSAALMNHSLGREYWNVYSVKLYDNIGLKRKPLVSEKVDIDDPLDTAARPLLLAIFGWFFWFVVYYFPFKKEIKSLDKKQLMEFRKNIGMIFQHFSLMQRKTVFENIALPMQIWGYPKSDIEKKVRELLVLVGLENKADSYPSELSGGQNSVLLLLGR